MPSTGRNGRKPIFLGILYPFKKGPNGLPATATDTEQVKNDLFYLLGTKKTERVMLPNFGLDLERLIFENTGPLLRAKITREIVTAIANFEPRVKVLSVVVNEQRNVVNVTVNYLILGLSDRVTIDVPRIEAT